MFFTRFWRFECLGRGIKKPEIDLNPFQDDPDKYEEVWENRGNIGNYAILSILGLGFLTEIRNWQGAH